MVGNLVRHRVAPGSSVTRVSDMGLPHYLEISDVGNNGEKFIPASESVAYQHWIFASWKWWALLLRSSKSTCLKIKFYIFFFIASKNSTLRELRFSHANFLHFTKHAWLAETICGFEPNLLFETDWNKLYCALEKQQQWKLVLGCPAT